MRDTRRITESQACTLLREWQEDLRLLDWDIEVAVRRAIELNKRADVNITETKKSAFIRLLHPDDVSPDEMQEVDMEVELVHEMHHVALAPFLDCDKGSHEYILQDQAIHRVSQLAVRLKREVRALRSQVKRKRAG